MELKPCPFCGTPPASSEIRGVVGYSFYVHCLECDADGPMLDERDDAIAAWNRRAPSGTGDETKTPPTD